MRRKISHWGGKTGGEEDMCWGDRKKRETRSNIVWRQMDGYGKTECKEWRGVMERDGA